MSSQGSEQRLLLVSPSDDVRSALDNALSGWLGAYRLNWVTQPELAASRAIELLPRIIIVDEGVGASPERYVRQLRDCCPMAAVVALVSSERVDLANRMVLAGARAVLQKPLQGQELQETLSALVSDRSVHAEGRGESGPGGRVLAVVGPADGVGRSTLAVNLAICLQQATGQLVALVDADFRAPSLDVMLNVVDGRTIAELWQRSGMVDAELLTGIVHRHASGIDVLLAPRIGDAELNPGTARIEQLLVLMKELFAWTVIDLGSPHDQMGRALSDGADVLLLVLPPDMVSLRNARILLDQMRGRGYSSDKIWGILNRATAPHGIPVGDIEDRLVKIRHSIPDDPGVALASVNRGVPICMKHRRSALSRSFHHLAEKLIEAYKDSPSPSTRTFRASSRGRGLLGRLRS